MSVGNLKTSGQHGNNFPFQLKVLNGLEDVINAITSSGSNVTITGPLGQQTMADSVSVVISSDQTGAERTPNFIRATGAGSLALVTYSVSVSNVGSANGQFLGSTIKPGETLNFSADAINNYFASGTFTYDGTGTELILIYNS